MTIENSPSAITFSGAELVRQIVKDLRAEGTTPVVAVEHALEAHLFEKFRDALGDRLIKPPAVRLHSTYFKERYATLPALAETGYETWYTEIHFSTRPGDSVDNLQFVADGISILPIHYGGGVYQDVQIKVRTLKRQINHQLRINHLQVPGRLFLEVKNQLAAGDQNQFKQPLIANFLPGPDIVGYRTVSYDHMLTGARLFCRCAEPFQKYIKNAAAKLAPGYAQGSWPQSVVALLMDATYAEEICHLCLARKFSPEDITNRYGTSIEAGFEAFVDQMQFDLGVDAKTAKADVKFLLGLSRWVREAELYGVVRDLFPDTRVLREASPEWLGRMRIDIYLPELKLAIEHQGEQHYRPIAVFGGEDAHLRVLERDALKRRLCQENGVTVIDVKYDAAITKAALRQRLRRFFGEQNVTPAEAPVHPSEKPVSS